MLMPIHRVRELFPALEQYTWLNAAASSPLSLPVAEAMKKQIDEQSRRGDLEWNRWLGFKEQLRERLAKFIGATASELAFTMSTSFGMHVVGQYLKQAGHTEVLTLEGEFPSTTIPFLHDGLTLRAVRKREDGSFTIDDIAAALGPQTKAIAVSAVQFSSGFRVDLQALSALCKARQLELIVNVAQALGQVPLDVKALGISFMVGTSHKWFAAGHGVGLLYIRKDWLEHYRLPYGGWLSVPSQALFHTFGGAATTPEGNTLIARGVELRKEASALEVGAWSWAPLFAIDAALTMHESVGVQNTLEHNLNLQGHLRRELRQRGFTPNTPDDPATGSGICVVPVAGDKPDAVVHTLLNERRIVTTARGGGLRISTHFFNTMDDVNLLLQAFDDLKISPLS